MKESTSTGWITDRDNEKNIELRGSGRGHQYCQTHCCQPPTHNGCSRAKKSWDSYTAMIISFKLQTVHCANVRT